MKFFEYFDSLDKDQFDAALNRRENLFVLAGPGSGKTKTLVGKALAEMEEHPVYIITFTTSAAEEIRSRIDGLMKSAPTSRIKNGLHHVGTLHSWALAYIRSRGVLGEVIDERTQAEVVAEVNQRLRLKIPAKRLVQIIAGDDPADNKERRFVEAYAKDMVEHGLISYDGILQRALTCTRHAPPRWHGAAPIFLIDEAQDSSVLDLRLYESLAQLGAQLWMVGDLQQAIYSFRHAQRADVWQWWAERWEGVAKLPTNYRSSQAVVKALNIINAEFRPRLDVVAASQNKGEVMLFEAATEAETLMQVRTRIWKLREKCGSPEEDCAVLCRTNRECEQVARMLAGEGMKVRAKRRTDEELLQVPLTLWAALGLYRQPQSDWMTRRYIRAIGADPAIVQQHAAQQMVPMAKVMYPALFASERTPYEWFSQSWMDMLRVPKAEQGWFYERMPEGWTDHSWDDITMLLFEAPRTDERGEGVTVTTIHSAKGREWRHVLMPFCDQMSYKPKNLLEEERVFFVGASRAIDTLSFFYAETRVDEFKGGMLAVAKCPLLDRLVEAGKTTTKKAKQ